MIISFYLKSVSDRNNATALELARNLPVRSCTQRLPQTVKALFARQDALRAKTREDQ